MFDSEFWRMTISTVVGAIIGAIIGSGVSYLIAKQTAQEAREVRRAERLETEKMAAHRVGLRLLELLNFTAGYHHAIEKGVREAESRSVGNGNFEIWQAIKSFSGSFEKLNIDPDDLIVFWQAKEFKYISNILFIFSDFSAMVAGAEVYSKRREKFLERLIPDAMTGLTGHLSLTTEEIKILTPEIAVLNDLANQMRNHNRDLYNRAVQIVNDFKPIVRKYFDDPKFPVPEPIKSDD